MEMLRNITAASSAASNPLLKSILGPNASEDEYKALAQQAESVWKMMDDLAENDPNAYTEFVRDAAKAAQEEVQKARDPHVEGLMPALVLEVQARQQPGPRAAQELVQMVAGDQAVARVHIWAANDASGVAAPHTAGGKRVSVQRPDSMDWSGLVVPVAEYREATTRPGPLPVHHFHVACHVSGVQMCIEGQPPAFRAAFLEAVSQFVEAEYRLRLSRSLRTLQVHRDAVGEAELQDLLRKQEEHMNATADRGSPADSSSEAALPKGLLDELRSLGTSAPKSKPPTGTATAGSKAAKKALIEELD